MSKKAFERIMAGLNEALEIAKGNAKPARLYMNGRWCDPDEFTKLMQDRAEVRDGNKVIKRGRKTGK